MLASCVIEFPWLCRSPGILGVREERRRRHRRNNERQPSGCDFAFETSELIDLDQLIPELSRVIRFSGRIDKCKNARPMESLWTGSK